MYDLEKEKREAIEAGERALASLKAAREDLRSAKNWGLWDMFGRGGLITSMIKHSKMDGAKQHMDQAKQDLMKFSKELRDVNFISNLNIETNDFLTFADWFMDGFFVDWMVQDRINKAAQHVNEAIGKVDNILRQLRNY